MYSTINERVLYNCELICNGKTLREISKLTGQSKSSVHVDVSKRIFDIDIEKGKFVHKILTKNFCNGHIKGGEVTKMKYKKLRGN